MKLTNQQKTWKVEPSDMMDKFTSPGDTEYKLWSWLCSMALYKKQSPVQVTVEQMREGTHLSESDIINILSHLETHGIAQRVSGF